MPRKNVTVALDEDVLKQARHLAVERGMSLSAFLGKTLQGMVGGAEAYRRSRDRQKALFRNPPDLGTGGRSAWKRDDLHER